MAQAGYTPIQLYYSTTAAAVPLAANLAAGELAINIVDGKLYYENNSGVVTLLASAAGASGDVVGPASATNNALARFDGTTGKLIKDSSALTFDGSNVGVTASSSAGFVGITTQNTSAGAGASSGIGINNDSTASTYLRTYGSGQTNTLLGSVIANYTALLSDGAASNGILLGSLTNKPVIFGVNNAEQMRLTSTGLGIGTSAPLSKLQVASNTSIAWGVGANATYGATTIGSASTSTSSLFVNTASLNTGYSSGLAVDGTYSSSISTVNLKALGVYSGGGYGGQLAFWTSSETTATQRMLLDSSGNLGLGVTPSAWLSTYRSMQIGLTSAITGLTNDTKLFLNNNAYFSASSQWVYSATSPATQYQLNDGQHRWYNAPSGTAGNAITFTQAMTLDASGRLGVGTTAPAYRLEAYRVDPSGLRTSPVDIASISAATPTTNEAYSGFGAGLVFKSATYANATPTVAARIRNKINDFSAGTDGSSIAFDVTATTSSALSQAMELNFAGNLGLGVIPNAWGSDTKAIQMAGSTFSAISGAARTLILANAYHDGTNFRYTSAGTAFQYRLSTGTSAHEWYTAASGTAGDAISFTQAMTLDASGNLEIGGTFGLGRKLNVDSATDGYTIGLLQTGAFNSNKTSGVVFQGYYDGSAITDMASIRGGKENTTSGNFGGKIAFYTRPNGGSDTERARISSAGNLILGSTTDQGRKLQVSGTIGLVDAALNSIGDMSIDSSGNMYIAPYNGSGSTIVFQTAPSGSGTTERARITSTGYFVVGSTTATTALLGSSNASNVPLIAAFSSAASGYTDALLLSEFRTYAPNNGTARFLYCGDNAAARAVIYSNGGLANYQGNNTNLSDRREKTNFAPATSYLDKICAIPVQTFNYIDQNMEDDGGLTLGVVAQDVQAVAPELVMESNWGTKEAPKMRLSIYQTDLQYALMKCIQEQQAIIESLKARLDAANL